MDRQRRPVFKFGGTALADGPRVRSVADLVRERVEDAPVVIVSAHSGVTQRLREAVEGAVAGQVDDAQIRIRHRSLCAQLGLESETLNRYWVELAHLLRGIAVRCGVTPAERDAVLSIGERVSARIVSMTLRAAGVFATPVDVFDLGFVAVEESGGVQPHPDSRARVRKALEQVPGVPVVTGFLARTESGLLTTLGPNGSDWTAAWIAEAIRASDLTYWKTVPGFMTADPAVVPEARVIERIAWADASALAHHGAEVLHPRSIAPAREGRIRVTLRDVRNPDQPGTRIEGEESSPVPVGLAFRIKSEDSSRISIVGGALEPAHALELLEDRGLQARIEPGEVLTLTVPVREREKAARLLHEHFLERQPPLSIAKPVD